MNLNHRRNTKLQRKCNHVSLAKWQHCIFIHLINGQMSMFQCLSECACACIEPCNGGGQLCMYAVASSGYKKNPICVLGVSIRRAVCHCMCVCVYSFDCVRINKNVVQSSWQTNGKRLSPLVFVCCISQHLLLFSLSRKLYIF